LIAGILSLPERRGRKEDLRRKRGSEAIAKSTDTLKKMIEQWLVNEGLPSCRGGTKRMKKKEEKRTKEGGGQPCLDQNQIELRNHVAD